MNIIANPADIKLCFKTRLYSELSLDILNWLAVKAKEFKDRDVDLYWKGERRTKPSYYLSSYTGFGHSADGAIGLVLAGPNEEWADEKGAVREIVKALAEVMDCFGPDDIANINGKKVDAGMFKALYELLKTGNVRKAEKAYGEAVVESLIGVPSNCFVANSRKIVAEEISRLRSEAATKIRAVNDDASAKADAVWHKAKSKMAEIESERDSQIAALMKKLEALDLKN